MEYTSLEKIYGYKECSAAAEELGYKIVELQIVPQHGMTHITVVISCADSKKDVGVADCSKAHRALAPVLMAFLNKTEDDISMEVCSPGIERNLKDAHEFEIFAGKEVRVWDKEISDWVYGKIKSSDQTSVTLEIEDGSEKTVVYENIAKAKFIHL